MYICLGFLQHTCSSYVTCYDNDDTAVYLCDKNQYIFLPTRICLHKGQDNILVTTICMGNLYTG